MSLLDRYDAMQSRPLGTNTGLYREPGFAGMTSDYKRQQSDYNMARRLLRSQARMGDANAAMGLIGLGDKARAEGVSFGGIQSYAGNQANIAGRVASQQNEIADMELGRQANRSILERTLNPNATAGAGRGNPLADEPMQTGERTALGVRAFNAMDNAFGGGANIGFRQGLDRAIGVAKTPQEMNDLRDAAQASGISTDAFNRRKNWWDSQRR